MARKHGSSVGGASPATDANFSPSLDERVPSSEPKSQARRTPSSRPRKLSQSGRAPRLPWTHPTVTMPHPSRTPLVLVVDQSHRELSDEEVAEGLAAGEDWAISEVWRRFAPLVIMTAERALGSRSDAEDVTQEAFSRVFRKLDTLRDRSSLRSFVYSIAIRTLKSHLRYRGLRDWLSFREPETLVDLCYSTQDVEARELVRSFYALLDRLSPRDRLVFILRRVESMTIEEIASSMELSTSTVKRSFAHASKRLAQWIATDPALAALLAQTSEAGRK